MRVSSVLFLTLSLTVPGSGAALAQARPSGGVEYYEAVTRNGRATRAPRRGCQQIQNAGRTLWECPTSRGASPAPAGAGTGYGVDTYTRPDGGGGGGY